MAEEKKENNPGTLEEKCDDLYCKVKDFVGKQVSDFVAFLFIIFSLGMIYGWFIANKQPQFSTIFLIIPPIIGVFAYFSRAFATAVFVAVIALVIIL